MWDTWDNWGDCSATCGGGTRTRTQLCDDEDSTDQVTCEGTAPSESENCNEDTCRK